MISTPLHQSASHRIRPWSGRVLRILAALCVTVPLWLCFAPTVSAQEPTGRIVPLPSPLADESLGLVRRTALELQDIAVKEKRPAFLILEIAPGLSEFHQCYALADFLTKEPLDQVTTVAWITAPLTGHNVIVALACEEIVVAPKASLGDIGNGQALPADQQAIVKSIVARRRNPRVTEALASALMDPAATLLQLTVETGENQRETRLATEAEARTLREQGAAILETRTVKDAGAPGVIAAGQGRGSDVLFSQVVESRKQLIDAYGIKLETVRELAAAEPVSNVFYIELHDVIDDVFAAFAERQIDRAVVSGADIIVFEIDSPGGILFVCEDLSRKILSLRERDIKTVAYVPRQAISAAAILAVSCDEIYMHPTASIGDAIPIKMMGNMIVNAENKILSKLTEFLRKIAIATERPPAVLEAFADSELEVFEVTNAETGRKWFMSQDEILAAGNTWNKGPRVPESRPGIALTVDGRRAHELLIAEAPVADELELRQRLGIPADMNFRIARRNWMDNLVFFLNNPAVVGMLFFVAIICIYLEMATMTGIFGILSALAFAVFFWAKVMGGTATGLEIAFFLIGAACLAMEIFVIPGFGVFGVSGILLIIGSLLMASQTISGLGIEYDIETASGNILTLGGAVLAVILAAFVISANFHRIPLLSSMVVTPPGHHEYGPDEPRLRPDLAGPHAALIGAIGTATTVLRPAGKARINGRLYDVVSDGPFIEPDTSITVAQVTGARIVVRAT